MALSEALDAIADRIVGFYDRGSSAPFVVYQYEPADEYKVRNELKDLKLAQEAAAKAGASTTMGATAEGLYALFDRLGGGPKDFSAILELLRGRAP